MQAKPNELIPGSAATNNEMDDMFSGLGLGSYVKKDSGAVAMGLMSQDNNSTASTSPAVAMGASGAADGKGLTLEEKRRLVRESENLQKHQRQAHIIPSPAAAPQRPNQPRDLTQSLMEKNLTQMHSSQSMSSMQLQQQQQQPSPFGAMNTSPSLFNNASSSSSQWGNFSQAPVPMQQQQKKPDLSAFDSLLSMPSSSSQQRQSMNSMMTPATTMSMANTQQQNKSTAAKPLSNSDISDLLG